MIERNGRGILTVALLDLDERNDPPSLGDQVNLASRNPHPPCENSPAVKAQPPGGDRLRPSPSRFRNLPVQPAAPSSSARA